MCALRLLRVGNSRGSISLAEIDHGILIHNTSRTQPNLIVSLEVTRERHFKVMKDRDAFS
jgi:hypothetical protein